MKQKFSLKGLALNIVAGLMLALAFQVSPLIGVAITGGLAIGKKVFCDATGYAMFVDLAPEIWTSDVKDNFFPDTSFMSEPSDFSYAVNADAINMAEAGADPSVLKNNTTYPVSTADAGDTPIRKVLDYYDTTTTVVRNAIAVELNYNQRQLYTAKHKRVLLQKISNDGAYAYAPLQAATLNPVLDATGDSASVILDRIIELQTAYNNMDAPTDGRILVMHPNHISIVAKEDKTLFKSFEATPGKMLFGFKVYQYTASPLYVKSTGVKAAQGVAFNGSIHARCSFSFLKDETMKAMGTLTMFSLMNDPALKGDSFNFQQRAYVDKIRNRYAGAILK